MNKALAQFIDNHSSTVAQKIYEDGMTIPALKAWLEEGTGLVEKRRVVEKMEELKAIGEIDDNTTLADMRADIEPGEVEAK